MSDHDLAMVWVFGSAILAVILPFVVAWFDKELTGEDLRVCLGVAIIWPIMLLVVVVVGSVQLADSEFWKKFDKKVIWRSKRRKLA